MRTCDVCIEKRPAVSVVVIRTLPGPGTAGYQEVVGRWEVCQDHEDAVADLLPESPHPSTRTEAS